MATPEERTFLFVISEDDFRRIQTIQKLMGIEDEDMGLIFKRALGVYEALVVIENNEGLAMVSEMGEMKKIDLIGTDQPLESVECDDFEEDEDDEPEYDLGEGD